MKPLFTIIGLLLVILAVYVSLSNSVLGFVIGLLGGLVAVLSLKYL